MTALPQSRFASLTAQLATLPPPPPPTRPAAAVAVVLAPDPDSLLLIRRAEREGDRWSGHLALPGGRWSSDDADLAATARRETLEEVGLDLSDAILLGALQDLEPRSPLLPPLVVRPFVYEVSRRAELTPNQEVAGAWWVPLEEFRSLESYQPIEYQRYGTLVRAAGYHLGVGVLWGITERILTPFLAMMRSPTVQLRSY